MSCLEIFKGFVPFRCHTRDQVSHTTLRVLLGLVSFKTTVVPGWVFFVRKMFPSCQRCVWKKKIFKLKKLRHFRCSAKFSKSPININACIGRSSWLLIARLKGCGSRCRRKIGHHVAFCILLPFCGEKFKTRSHWAKERAKTWVFLQRLAIDLLPLAFKGHQLSVVILFKSVGRPFVTLNVLDRTPSPLNLNGQGR